MDPVGSRDAGGGSLAMKRKTRVVTGVAVVLVIALAAGGFALWQVFGGSAPPPVAHV